MAVVVVGCYRSVLAYVCSGCCGIVIGGVGFVFVVGAIVVVSVVVVFVGVVVVETFLVFLSWLLERFCCLLLFSFLVVLLLLFMGCPKAQVVRVACWCFLDLLLLLLLLLLPCAARKPTGAEAHRQPGKGAGGAHEAGDEDWQQAQREGLAEDIVRRG